MADSERWYEKQRVKLDEWSKTGEGRTHPYADIIQLLPDYGITIVRLINDPDVSVKHKIFLAATVAYIASPIDLMPEAYLGPPGFADDVVVAAFALKQLFNGGEKALVERHWAGEGDAEEIADHTLGAADHLVGKKQWRHIKEWLTHLFDKDE